MNTSHEDLTQPITGSELIAAERARQMNREGYTPEHDDQHRNSEIVTAAIAYAINTDPDSAGEGAASVWPWERELFKPSPCDPIRDLAKAGALIAAEIDRLLRLKEKEKS